MRIDPYSQINQVYQASKKSPVGQAGSTQGTDKVEISQFGKDYQTAKQAVSDSSDIREDLVKQTKEQIDAGTYDVSADDFAAKLAEKYGTTLF